MYGGAALPGRLHGRDVTVLDTYEAVGGVYAGTVTRKELDVLEHVCLPGLGACPGQFSANTMAMVSETLGLALPGSATMPAVDSERSALAQRSGQDVSWRSCKKGGPLPRELVTKKSLENACAAVAATGGSTNAGLHIPAIAHEAGIKFSLDDLARVAKRTPHSRRHEAGRKIPCQGPAQDRRRLRGVEGAAQARRAAWRLPDHFWHDSGKRIEVTIREPTGRSSARSRSPKPAASWSSRATSRPTARC